MIKLFKKFLLKFYQNDPVKFFKLYQENCRFYLDDYYIQKNRELYQPFMDKFMKVM